MNIRHLKIFMTVADYGKMSVAAEKLYISQPSVSQAVKEIEDYYGIKVFERLSKKLYITESGKILLKYARHIVSSFDEMEMELKNINGNISFRIGATVTVGNLLLKDIISKFEANNSEVSTRILINNTTIIEKMLLTDELDIGIVEGTVTNKDLIQKSILKDELVLVAGKSHKFYNKEMIEVNELNGESFILREEGSGSRERIISVLEDHEIEYNIKWNSTDTELIKIATIDGQGLSILSKLMIKEELKSGELQIININGIEIIRDICLIYHKNKFISEYLQKLINSIEEL